MFKRLFWLVTGASFGFGSSFWLQRGVKRTVARYKPAAIAARVGQDVVAAVGEGRVAMDQREAQLRAARQRAVREGAALSRTPPKALRAAR